MPEINSSNREIHAKVFSRSRTAQGAEFYIPELSVAGVDVEISVYLNSPDLQEFKYTRRRRESLKSDVRIFVTTARMTPQKARTSQDRNGRFNRKDAILIVTIFPIKNT